MPNPLCFVLMPFGTKPGLAGSLIDFDSVYRELIAPAISAAGLEPLRADEEMTGGIIHKPMFERLILCEYAVADLTTANANVFYELGIRHAVRPWSTVLVFAAGGSRLPFDVAPLRALPYQLDSAGKPAEADAARKVLTDRLNKGKDATTDSPLYQLVEGFPDISHTKTDVFRDRIRYAAEVTEKLGDARKKGVDAVRSVERDIGDIRAVEAGVALDLLLSYRAVKAWPEMIDLVKKMSPPLTATVMVQEQLALALNRNDKGEEAERVLLELLATRGPSSETYGILGRVYKDRWESAIRKGKTMLAEGLLDKAIDAYLKGFETDWRDAYPGVNARTLMEIKEPPDSRREKLHPVVAYAVERRIAAHKADYWDHATRLELAVLAMDARDAEAALCDALSAVREVWEPETTLRNLRLIGKAREARGNKPVWQEKIERELEQATKTASA